MNYNRIKKTLDFISGNDKDHSLEQRLLIFALLMGIFMGLLGTITNSIITTSFVAALIPLTLAFGALILYYFVRFKKKFKQLSFITALVGIFGVAVVWVFNGGIDGPDTMVAFAILNLALVIVSQKGKKIIIVYFILINITVLLIQFYRPDLIEGYSSATARWFDYLVCLIYSSVFIYLIITFIHKHYTIEKKRAEENEKKVHQKNIELEKANSDKDRFIQVLAHDLKSPFNTLLGFSNLLLKNIRKYDIDKIEQQLKIIHQTNHQTYNLLEDLLLWSKSTSGRIQYEPQMIIFRDLCADILDNLSNLAHEKEIFINQLDPEKTILMADMNMSKSILRNLISNAIKFTNKKGHILIYTEKKENFVIITVSDDGIGIDAEKQEKLWDFSHPYTTTGTAGEKGTGFGLILCKEFVEKHNGKIWVESIPGKGSNFRFTLPLYHDSNIKK